MTSLTDAEVTTRLQAPPPQRKKRLSPRVRTIAVFSYLMLIALAMIYIYPFLVAVSSSFKTDADATANPLQLIPEVWSLAAYNRLFTDVPLPLWTFNTAFITVIVTCGRVFFDSLAGYALSRLQFRGRTVIFAVFIGVMSVPGVVLLIPRFLILQQLGLYDTYGGMIIPLLKSAAGIFIMKQFFDSIPVSVEERAHRRREHLPHLPHDRAADGAARPHHPVHPELPGLVERVRPLHRLAPECRPEHVDDGRGIPRLGPARIWQPVSASARCRDPHDDSGGDHLLHLPEADHEQHGWCREGVTV